jgi:phosphoglycerate kinase
MTARPPALRGLPLLEDLGELDGRRVLVRADFNVPIIDGPKGCRIADDMRITATLPTLKWLQERGATVVCCSHLGRPTDGFDEHLSLMPVAKRLAALAPGIEVMENLRFDPREVEGDPTFVAELIEGFDAYVNDAFGASHRSHASMIGPPKFLPSAAGRLVAREVEVLGGMLTEPTRPFVAIVGGAKVADKLGVLDALSTKADVIIVGGGMAFTFLAAQGRAVGGSMLDESKLDACRKLLKGPATILLPTDVVALEPGAGFGQGERGGEVRRFDGDLDDGWVGLDVGPQSAASFAEAIATAGTVLWNGPMGVFEDERFAEGTRVVGEAVASCQGKSIVGGGDSARAVDELGLCDEIDFISTGGGASLEFLEYGDLPALAALRGASNAPHAL